MKTKLIMFIILLAGLASTGNAGPSEDQRCWNNYPVVKGPFDRSWQSLNQWECPAWFQDAKLGIWMHWGPQAVPMEGDWYAWGMYIQGNNAYTHHLKHYGHPSEFGYKDIINLFNPTEMDFEERIKMYKDAGAKYVFMLAVHHDNYDLWDSKYHSWDAVDKMPHRDLVGEFTQAARKHGMRYGLSAHIDKGLAWMQGSHKSDEKGPMKGVPYDGADPQYQDLYCPPFENDNEVWHRTPYDPPEWWEQNWFNRMKDLVDQYQPDAFYFDGTLPFKHDDYAVGRQLLANYYNGDIKKNNGKLEAVMCLKNRHLSDLCVPDYERRGVAGTQETTWQTDTCIGNWYYSTSASKRYKSVPEVIFMLVDIVSKNGNLLLSVPVHPSGEPQKEELAFLKGLGDWLTVNGYGIYGTRPWLVYGEGNLDKTNYGVGGMHEAKVKLSEGDYRFTAKEDTDVFAFFMVWPESNVAEIKSLANHSTDIAKIKSIKLLGSNKKLKFDWDREGLKVYLPKKRPCQHTWALHIEGQGLRSFNVPAPKQQPYSEQAVSIPGTIEAENYDRGGQTIAYHDTDDGNQGDQYRQDDVDISVTDKDAHVSHIENGEWIEYTVDMELGIYEITADVACTKAGGKMALLLDGERVGTVGLPITNSQTDFKTVKIAKQTLQESKGAVLRVKFSGTGICFDKLTFNKVGMPPVITQYLSDLDWGRHDSPTEREPYKDRDRDGGFLVINGVTYDKGIGCDSQMSITYDLKGQFLRFMSDVGVDDDADDSPASLKFQVYLDGQKAYDSGLMTWKTEVRKIDLDVTGVQEMKLVVDDADGSRHSDHADWANARLIRKITGQ